MYFNIANAIWSYPINKHMECDGKWVCKVKQVFYTQTPFLAYSMSTCCVGTQVAINQVMLDLKLNSMQFSQIYIAGKMERFQNYCFPLVANGKLSKEAEHDNAMFVNVYTHSDGKAMFSFPCFQNCQHPIATL